MRTNSASLKRQTAVLSTEMWPDSYSRGVFKGGPCDWAPRKREKLVIRGRE